MLRLRNRKAVVPLQAQRVNGDLQLVCCRRRGAESAFCVKEGTRDKEPSFLRRKVDTNAGGDVFHNDSVVLELFFTNEVNIGVDLNVV